MCNWVYFSLAECNCSPCGTDSCHPRTGQCFCKTGVTGQHCDRCEVRATSIQGRCLSLARGRGAAPMASAPAPRAERCWQPGGEGWICTICLFAAKACYRAGSKRWRHRSAAAWAVRGTLWETAISPIFLSASSMGIAGQGQVCRAMPWHVWVLSAAPHLCCVDMSFAVVKTLLGSRAGVARRLSLPREGSTRALLLSRAPTVLLLPRRDTMASRAAPAAGGVTATSALWAAAVTRRPASAAACPASAARAASSAPRATGASARAAVRVSPASRVSRPACGGVGQGGGGTRAR